MFLYFVSSKKDIAILFKDKNNNELLNCCIKKQYCKLADLINSFNYRIDKIVVDTSLLNVCRDLNISPECTIHEVFKWEDSLPEPIANEKIEPESLLSKIRRLSRII